MGCTRNYTMQDHAQFMRSLQKDPGRPPFLEQDRLAQVRDKMNTAAAQRIVNILSKPESPARQAVSNYLVRSMNSSMTDK